MVSIVVPVYNAERFIVECVNSILSQTYQDWELILVDDGSKDSSGRICDKLADTDSRVRVIHRANGGVTAARRDGVLAAVGEWIFFVDADDKVEIDGLREIVGYATQHPECDIIEGSYVWFYPDGSVKQRPCIARGKSPVIQTGLEYAINLYKEDYGSRGPWSKIIRKSVLLVSDALMLPKWMTNREDALMLTIVAQKVCKAVLTDIPVYKYRNQFCETAVSNKLSMTYWSNYLQYLDEVVLKDNFEKWQEVWKATVIDVFKIIVHGSSKTDGTTPYFRERVIPTLRDNKDTLPLYDRLVLSAFQLPKHIGGPISKALLALIRLKNSIFKDIYAKQSRKDKHQDLAHRRNSMQYVDNQYITTPPHERPLTFSQSARVDHISDCSRLVSIVVPVYNAEKYLDECISSIIEQRYQNWELILVNDGSTDSSGQICERYAEQDFRIRVIHKANEGVTAARRDGVYAAKGEWVFFVDADDKVEAIGLYGLMNYSQSHPDIDIIEGTYKWFYPDRSIKFRPCIAVYEGPIVMNGENYAISMCSGRHGATGPWMKIIRKSALSSSKALEIIPSKFTNREDTLMNVIVAQHIRHYALIDVPVYLYRNQFGESAITKCLSWEYWTDYLKWFKELTVTNAREKWEDVFAVHTVDVFNLMVYGNNTFRTIPTYFYTEIVPTLWVNRNSLPKTAYLILAGFKSPMGLGLPVSYSLLALLRLKNRLLRGYYAKQSRKH